MDFLLKQFVDWFDCVTFVVTCWKVDMWICANPNHRKIVKADGGMQVPQKLSPRSSHFAFLIRIFVHYISVFIKMFPNTF